VSKYSQFAHNRRNQLNIKKASGYLYIGMETFVFKEEKELINNV